MDQGLLPSLLAVVAMLGTILGLILGWGLHRSRDAKLGTEIERLRRHAKDLSQELTRTQNDLSRKKDIAAKIPMVVRKLSGRLTPQAIPAIATRLTKEFFHASHAGFFAAAGGGDKRFTLVEGVGFSAGWKGKIRLAADEGILGMAFHNGIVTTREEFLATRGKWPTGIESIEKNGVTPDLVAPVVVGSKIVGALVVVSELVSLSRETPFASMIADLVGGAFENATTIETVEHSASVDPLTKVHTRGHFARRFEMEMRKTRNYDHFLALLLLDIDHFKKVNDTHGHQAGDLILIGLGRILRDNVRAIDLAARYGGEEFAVLLTSSEKADALTFAEKLRAAVESAEFQIPGRKDPLRVTVSIGVAAYPADGNSTTELLSAADRSLYEAKELGRNRVVGTKEVGLDGVPLT